ncbi:YHS domain-containing protein [Flavobacterium piscinae]|uniref:YHS domain-containing protein n=1 Tax=Flavobacterium piscinae TaxID=2506424 RepID=A0A4V1N3J4_9FLAO|nr:YHS domain-containing (seleno)protein [Flavobacterium piscinae]RXR28876.1 YHS domain-containing protein [Flavobacterium piscinae]
MKTKIVFLLLLLAVIVLITIYWFIVKDKNLDAAIYSTNGMALNGYDMVDLVDHSTLQKGNKEIYYTYQETDWYFSSLENRNTFASNPEQYIPQYGGYCAYGMSKGYKAPTQIETWSIVEGKLYLNYNLEVKKIWINNQKDFIQQADKNWSTIQLKK